MTALKLEVIPWQGDEKPSESKLRRRLEADGYAVWAWSDLPGASYEPHTHDEDESIWVVEGRIDFEVGGRAYPLRAGDRLMLPRGTVHTARVGGGGARYLVGQRRG